MQNYNNEEKRKRYPQNQPQDRKKRDDSNDSERYDFENKFNPKWIKNEATKELVDYKKMVDYADKAGKFMAKNELTNSKIRNIYGEIKRIQMSGFENEKPSFYLLKPKVAYTLGRDKNNEGLKLFKKIFDMASASVTDQKSYQNFCNLMEAFLAYHKFYGGKD